MEIQNQMFKPHLPVELTLDLCIKCNICTTACPVSAVTDLFPGPKYEAPQAGRFRHPDQPTVDKSVDYCSGCRVCNMVCPTGVKIAEINARARAEMVRHNSVPLVRRLRNNIIARAEVLGKIGQPIAPLSNAIFSFPPARVIAEKTLGIARDAPFPPFSRQRFTSWFKSYHSDADSYREVIYFHGCSTQYYEPRVGRAAVHVLEANGFRVIVPPQNCCGLPLLSNGEFKSARKYHTNNVNNLIKYARKGIPIVGTSTSCTLTLKEEAPELLDMYDVDTQMVARNIFDLNEFLISLYENGNLNLNFQEINLTLPYHVPCQYRAHRIGYPGIRILQLIPGLKLELSDAACCGIAGTYGYKKEKYEIAMQVGQSLFEFIIDTESPLAVCDSETCRWQIKHATGIPTIHPIEILASAYGFPPEFPLSKILLQENISL